MMSVDTLRETFHISRISAEDLEDFLTAQTYRAEITAARSKVKSLNHGSLQSACDTPIRQGKSPKYIDGEGLACIKPKNTRELIVDLTDCDTIDAQTESDIRRQKLEYGDVVITRSGSGTIGRASIFTGDGDFYTNDHLFIVRVSEADGFYVGAFLKCYWGERLLESGISGSTGQLNLSNEHIKQITLYQPDPLVQKYIGNKVRQAEKLRSWSKRSSHKIFDNFSFLTSNLPKKQSVWRASSTVLSTYRINPKQYDPVALDMLRRAKEGSCDLVPLGELIGSRGLAGGATPKGATYLESGVLFARVQNVKPLCLDLSDAVFVDSETDYELRRSRCEKDDIVFTITGYPGTAALVTEQDLPVNINQHSVRLHIEERYPAGYVCAALNSEFVKTQVDRAAIGGTREALDYPSVRNLWIPLLPKDEIERIDSDVRSIIAANQISKALIATAKSLVESLVEGSLLEKEIIEAQKSLEADDDSLDKAILARLNENGGSPLFTDLDQLYNLLALSKTMDE
ncbi:restriction endonuclease subunit S [Parahaliea mediterranea]|uniref:restriction endonuclease subunit S n=1 Tax=Parahaliea mediterranea TaxID=651086 RepID=UPI00130029D7|nr:restriction endonuclease subunit S [Parahaliea mediterranea]